MSIPLGQPDGLTEVRRVFFADDISNMFPGSAEITLKDILKKIPFQNINYPHVINYTVSQDYTRFIFQNIVKILLYILRPIMLIIHINWAKCNL